jgi:uncharacterized Fe-S cluster-containing radical SAM superfamily protein
MEAPIEKLDWQLPLATKGFDNPDFVKVTSKRGDVAILQGEVLKGLSMLGDSINCGILRKFYHTTIQRHSEGVNVLAFDNKVGAVDGWLAIDTVPL